MPMVPDPSIPYIVDPVTNLRYPVMVDVGSWVNSEVKESTTLEQVAEGMKETDSVNWLHFYITAIADGYDTPAKLHALSEDMEMGWIIQTVVRDIQQMHAERYICRTERRSGIITVELLDKGRAVLYDLEAMGHAE